MPKKISTVVTESEKKLQILLNKNKTDRVRGRLKALLQKKGKVSYQSKLASKQKKMFENGLNYIRKRVV